MGGATPVLPRWIFLSAGYQDSHFQVEPIFR